MPSSVRTRLSLIALLSVLASCDAVHHGPGDSPQAAAEDDNSAGERASGTANEVVQPEASAESPAGASGADAPASREEAQASAEPTPKASRTTAFTLDTKIGELVEHPAARAVVERYAPEIIAGSHLQRSAGYSLREIAPIVHGMITDEELEQMELELAGIR